MAQDGIHPLASLLNPHISWTGAPTSAETHGPVLTQFINAGESVTSQRAQALRQVFDASLSATDPTEQHALFLRGIELAEAFLAAGESAAGVREQALSLFVNDSLALLTLHRPDASLASQMRLWTQAWCGPYPPGQNLDLPVQIEAARDDMLSILHTQSAARLLPMWHETLRHTNHM